MAKKVINGMILPDGRSLIIAYDDLHAFFDSNSIINKTIQDIRLEEEDYVIWNLEDLDITAESETSAEICTDSVICFIFADGSNLEVYFSGQGPLLIGKNIANFSKYKPYDGYHFKASTMFSKCIGHSIQSVAFHKSNHRMLFPVYQDIDLSGQDDGVSELLFSLDDESKIRLYGAGDYFQVEHIDANDAPVWIPLYKLISDMKQ